MAMELATESASRSEERETGGDEGGGGERPHEEVVMLHTGGTMGLFGLAQRYPSEFQWDDEEVEAA